MTNGSRIDKYIERKLSESKTARTSENFTRLLMENVNAEYKLALQENKWNRAAKFIMGFIGSFTFVVLSLSVYFYVKSSKSTPELYGESFSIDPSPDTGINFFEQFILFIQSIPIKAFNLLGLSASPQAINIILFLLVLASIYWLADKIFVKHKLRIR
ncbi:MAG: hypothetical protein ACRDFC_02775 [Ignavibacteria bacterium]